MRGHNQRMSESFLPALGMIRTSRAAGNGEISERDIVDQMLNANEDDHENENDRGVLNLHHFLEDGEDGEDGEFSDDEDSRDSQDDEDEPRDR